MKKAENPNFFVFYLICLKFGIRDNFDMLITKSKPKLKLENDLSKKLQFSTDFSQNCTEHHKVDIAAEIKTFFMTRYHKNFKNEVYTVPLHKVNRNVR